RRKAIVRPSWDQAWDWSISIVNPWKGLGLTASGGVAHAHVAASNTNIASRAVVCALLILAPVPGQPQAQVARQGATQPSVALLEVRVTPAASEHRLLQLAECDQR